VQRQGHRRRSTYAIATLPQRRMPAALECIVTEASEPYLYLRAGPDRRILCGGEDEEIADADPRDALLPGKMEALRGKLARLLPDSDTTPEFGWSGVFGESETGLPSIGPVPGIPNCWAVLGFGGNGMTYAAIAAEVIPAALQGQPDPDADLYATL
jgi:glycine/D-amino acid oxidase-like deaminating enzyme